MLVIDAITVQDEYCEFLELSSWVAPSPSLLTELATIRADAATPGEYALAAAGLPLDPALIVEGAFMQAGGYAGAEQLLALDDVPSAIFCANDEMAFGAIDAISSKGLKVPADISVMGFDDIATARFVFPTLTTVRQPFVDMAARAVGEVVDIIQGREFTPGKIAFATEIIIRNSTGPAPGS